MKLLKALLINDTSLVFHHGCTLLMDQIYENFKKKILIKNIIYHEENFDNFQITSSTDYDLALINGEGTIHGSTSKITQIFNLIKRLKNKKIPIFLFNSTISNLNKKQLKLLKLINRIYVRESATYKYLKKNKIKSQIVPDFLSLLSKNKKTNIKKTIFVTDSSIPNTTKKLMIFAKITFILKIKSLKNIFFFLKKKKAINFKKKVENSNFLITGRFHAIFIALCSKTPFVTFESDTHKTRALLKDIGIENRILKIKTIIDKKKILINNFSKLEINNIKKYRKKAKILISKCINEIINIVNKK